MIKLSEETIRDQQIRDIGRCSPESIFVSFTSIGGKRGWLAYDFLWQLRGLIDKLIGGVGCRGRKNPISLEVGDYIDFWKVVDIQKNKRLLLEAQMKVPGDAYLEFIIKDEHLIQNAYYKPYRFSGEIYWFLFIPFHMIIFKKMADKIIEDAK